MLSRKSSDLPPITDLEEMKTIMQHVFVPGHYDLEFFNKYHAWKMTHTMRIRKYSKGFRTMAMRLNSIKSEME